MARPSQRRTSSFKLPQGQPQPQVPSVMNTFTGGFKTEYTGLNFPENAATSSNNCTFTRVGNITRRNGFDFESNFTASVTNRTNDAISTFLWENAGGDGNTVLEVTQIGPILSFYNVSTSTVATPLSTQKLVSFVDMSVYQIVPGSTFAENQYASGNGYLFIFNPGCDPVYCTYVAGVVSSFSIQVKIRDFIGIPEPTLPDTVRPFTLSDEHNYNLQNQGWTSAPLWSMASSTINITKIGATNNWTLAIGNINFTVPAGITGVVNGTIVSVVVNVTRFGSSIGTLTYVGSVFNYVGTTLTITISSNPGSFPVGQTLNGVTQSTSITPANPGGNISAWNTAINNFPSNSDVWWTFKNSLGVFPTGAALVAQLPNVTLGGPAPKGSYILQAFTQQRDSVSGILSLTDVTTLVRPKTGAWFQGRVWYAGVDDSFNASGDEPFSTWTENVYFSQIAVSTSNFSKCYQTNDPTSETLPELLPTDGGVITIQGSGSIYKLFSVLNGLLVFAANGIWFITGNSGLGFTANDFTVSKLSGEHALSGNSFVSITGYPIFWNADGIYAVMPGQSLSSGQKSLEVKNLTLPTIKQFYQNIPLSSKKLARGSYNHITGVVQWVYKSTEAVSITDAYSFDSILNFLTYTEAFYNWTLPSGGNLPTIHSVTYIEGPGGLNVPSPLFKYYTSRNSSGVNYAFTFSEEKDNINWVDYISSNVGPITYQSTFITGYSIKGQALRKFQPQYIYMYSEIPAYTFKLQGVWSYAATTASNQFSTEQIVTSNKPTSFSKDIRRLRIRGNGYVLQLKVDSVSGKPFTLAGWAILDTIGIS